MKKEQIQECCYDIGNIPYEIPDTFGEGIIGKVYYTDKAERPRIVTLEITTFRGVAWDAVHYYGRLYVSRVPVKKEGSKSCFCGYLGEDTPLFKDLNIIIELWRYVTDVNRKEDPIRYDKDMKVTNGWYDKASIKKLAKEVFKARFTGDWKLVVNDYTE